MNLAGHGRFLVLRLQAQATKIEEMMAGSFSV